MEGPLPRTGGGLYAEKIGLSVIPRIEENESVGIIVGAFVI